MIGNSIAVGKLRQIILGAIAQRPQHHDVALVVEQFRRHRGEPAAMEEVHEERFEDVLAVVAEHQRRAALLPRDAVEMAAPQPRAERAIGLAFRHLLGDDRIGVLVFDAVLDAVCR